MWVTLTSLVVRWLRIHLPVQGTCVWFLVPRDYTWCRAVKVRVPQLLSLDSGASKPQLLKPTCLAPVLPNKRSHRESQCTATRSNPRSLQTEEAFTQQWRPSTTKNKSVKKKNLKSLARVEPRGESLSRGLMGQHRHEGHFMYQRPRTKNCRSVDPGLGHRGRHGKVLSPESEWGKVSSFPPPPPALEGLGRGAWRPLPKASDRQTKNELGMQKCEEHDRPEQSESFSATPFRDCTDNIPMRPAEECFCVCLWSGQKNHL